MTLDFPNSRQRTTAYVNYMPILSDEEMGLPYTFSLRKEENQGGAVSIPFTPPASLFAVPNQENHREFFDRYGKQTVRHDDPAAMLPGAVGPCWELAIPELPANGATNGPSARR